MAEYVKNQGRVGTHQPSGRDKVAFTVVKDLEPEKEGQPVRQETIGNFTVPAGTEPRCQAEVEIVVRDAKTKGA